MWPLPSGRSLAPVIYSRTVAMSPLTVLLVSLTGAVLGGIVGVLIAIPLASAGAIAVGGLLPPAR